MTNTMAIWAASIAGAMLFFFAGLLSSRKKKSESVAASAMQAPAPAMGATQEVNELRRMIAEMQNDLAAKHSEIGTLHNAERASQQSIADFKGAVAAMQGDRDVCAQTSAKLQQELNHSREQMVLLQKQRVAFEEKTKSQDNRTTGDIQRHIAAARQKQVVIETLEANLKASEDNTRRYEVENLTLRNLLKDLQGKVTEGEGRSKELAALKLKRASTYVDMEEVTRKQSSRMYENLVDALQSVVSEIAEFTKGQAVVLADRTGLPLVVAGEHGQELAAYASIVADLAERTSSFVPVATPDYANFVDKDGQTVSVWPFKVHDETYSIAILVERDLYVNIGNIRNAIGDVIVHLADEFTEVNTLI